MNSQTTLRFRKAFKRLPPHVQELARSAFKIWLEDPGRPSLRFKRVHQTPAVYSVRIGLDWRALGVREGSEMTWFWIGSHSDYEKLVAQL